jgi:hypothetical protein
VHAPGHGVLLDRALARLADEFARLGLAHLAPGEPATMAGRSVA